MNEKFFNLPDEKQQRIINSGYSVFSQNSYKKSPMSEIADGAGISKSLLFHYFKNKKELYLFLWEKAAQTTIEYLTEYGCYEPADLFEKMERGMRAKLQLMYKYPNMTNFVFKAFYETDPEVRSEIQKSYQKYCALKANDSLAQLDPEDFIPGLDLEMMHREMYWASEGYIWEVLQSGSNTSLEVWESNFTKMLEFWKSIYKRKGGD